MYSFHQLEGAGISCSGLHSITAKKESYHGYHVGYIYSIIFMSTTHVCVVYIGLCLNVSQARDILNWLNKNHTFFTIQELGSQF